MSRKLRRILALTACTIAAPLVFSTATAAAQTFDDPGVTGNPLRLDPILASRTGSALDRRAPCQKRIDGVQRTIGSRRNLSCRKATQITRRYILHKELPGQWYCSHLGASFGKCVDKKELYSEECVDRELRCVSSFNYAPGQRA